MNGPDATCLPITDCSINPCVFGDCVTVAGIARCNCQPNYYGRYCDKIDVTTAEPATGFAMGGIIAIVICLLVLLCKLLL